MKLSKIMDSFSLALLITKIIAEMNLLELKGCVIVPEETKIRGNKKHPTIQVLCLYAIQGTFVHENRMPLHALTKNLVDGREYIEVVIRNMLIDLNNYFRRRNG